MPAALPASSGYTYAVELSVDKRSKPGPLVYNSTGPFRFSSELLAFPGRHACPVGYYDRVLAQWVPSQNGRVISILSEANGSSVLDVDGSGKPPTRTQSQRLGVTEDELQRLADLYDPGQTLWRVPVTHFTPVDLNWPFLPPADAVPPSDREPRRDEVPYEQDVACGSIIGIQGQTLSDTVPITGTPFSLVYRSDRTSGYVATQDLQIPLDADSNPASLKKITLEITIAGQRIEETFVPGPISRPCFAGMESTHTEG